MPSVDVGGDLRTTRLDESLDTQEMAKNLEKEKDKFERVEGLCSTDEKEAINDLFESAAISVKNAETDEDDKRKANQEIKQLRAKIEKISESKKIDKLKLDFNNLIESLPALIENAPEDSDKESGKEMLASLKSEGEKAISESNEILLARTNEQLVKLVIKYYYANPAGWVDQFNRHSNGEFAYTNPQAARYFIEKGKKALESNNIDDLKDAVKELQNLMVDKNEVALTSMLSGLTH
jgi:hypothetical protein